MKDKQTQKVLKELQEWKKLANVTNSVVGDICKMAISEIERLTKNHPETFYECCGASTQGLHTDDCILRI